MNNPRIFLLFLSMLSCASINAQSWQSLGPFNRSSEGIGTPNGQGSGIVITAAFHPKYNTNYPTPGSPLNKTIFVGSPYGGIWISKDDGANWSTTDAAYPNLTTDFLFRGCGITDIAIDPVTPTTMYAAFASSEVSQNFVTMGNNYPATGIYKYTPSTGWVSILSYPYLSNHSIAEIRISPRSTPTLFACTDAGVIKLTNSGTWSAPVTVATEGAGRPFKNILFAPNDTSVVFACGRQIYKSINGGNSFTSISNFTAADLPDLFGEIWVSNISVISSTSVYARVHYKGIDTNGNEIKIEKFFRYNGSSWTPLPMFPVNNREYNYDRMPLLAKKVGTTEYVYGGSEVLNLYNSEATPPSWTEISDYNGNMHADIHDIVFSPEGSTLLVAHDGGVSKTTANFYTTPSWTTVNNGLNIATVYSFSGSQKNPALILVGERDNGNSIVKNATSISPTWKGYMTCDGGDKMTSLYDPMEWYDRKEQYGFSSITRNTNGNENDNGTSIFTSVSPVTTISQHVEFQEFGDKKPLVMDPNNPNIIYKGSNILLRSMDKGNTSQILFRKSDCFDTGNYDLHSHINCIAVAPTNSNYLYINFINPYSFEPLFANHIYKTTTALTANYAAACVHSGAPEGVNCGNWTDITPNFGVSNKKSVINSIVVSDKDPNVIWAGFNYNPDITPAGNRKNYLVWKYDGTNWSNWGTGLPDNVSITSLVYERGSNDGIYAGTDVAGIFYRSNTTGGWIPYGSNMPHAIVNQLEINNTENTIRAGTYGRGLWKNSLYCPNTPFNSPNPCAECNTSPYFWEGATVTIENATLSTKKQYIRAVNVIDILKNTTITASANVSYDLYIHGCEPGQKNSYRKITEEIDDDNIVIDSRDKHEAEKSYGIAVFPNPNNGEFTLNTGSDEEKDIYVYNILGEIIYQKNKTVERILDISISNAPKGMYLLKLVSDDKTETVKIINQ